MYKIFIKAFADKESQKDLIISDNVESMIPLINPIKKSGIFHKVFTYHYDSEDHIHSMQVKRGNNLFTTTIFFLKRYIQASIHQQDLAEDPQLRQINFMQYDEIFTSDFDVSRINGYLAVHQIPYTLMEHAKYVFNNQNIGLLYNCLTYISTFLDRLGFITGIRIATKFCEYVEVHENKNLGKCLRLKRIKEWNIDAYLKRLTKEDKHQIFCIYAEAYRIKLNMNNLYNLFLTNPLSKDYLVRTEKEQIEFYKKIVSQYLKSDIPLLIKPHPRDDADYKKYFEDTIIIPKEISSEVLILETDLHIKKAITFYSTSVEIFSEIAQEVQCIEKSEIDARSSSILKKFLQEVNE